MMLTSQGRVFNARFCETDWNGIPAYIQYVRDVTKEVETEEEASGTVFPDTMVKACPEGVAVVCRKKDRHHEARVFIKWFGKSRVLKVTGSA
ncbi:MAG: hypothetical protein ACLTW9_30735 [Enterocloster sp.]